MNTLNVPLVFLFMTASYFVTCCGESAIEANKRQITSQNNAKAMTSDSMASKGEVTPTSSNSTGSIEKTAKEVRPSERTCQITAIPQKAVIGSEITLNVSFEGSVDRVILDGADVSVANPQKAVKAGISRKYEASVFSSTGIVKCYVDVIIAQPEVVPSPNCNLVAEPSKVSKGGTVTLTMHVTGSVTETLLADEPLPVEGSKKIVVNATTAFIGHVSGPGGQSTCSASVAVDSPVLPPAPTCSIVASPQSVPVGSDSVLKLIINGEATTAILDGKNIVGTDGTKIVTVSKQTSYTGSVSNLTGTNTCSVVVSTFFPPTSKIDTVAGVFQEPLSAPQTIAIDKAGLIYVFDSSAAGQSLRVLDPTTGKWTKLLEIGPNRNQQFEPHVAFDSEGKLYFTDPMRCLVNKFDRQTSTTSAVAGNGTCGLEGDGTRAISAKLNYPTNIIFDAYDNLYISDSANGRVRKVDVVTRNISTVTGTSTGGSEQLYGPATGFFIGMPAGLAIDKNGDLYIAQHNGSRVFKLTTATSTISALNQCGRFGDIAKNTASQNLAVDANGTVYVTNWPGPGLIKWRAGVCDPNIQLSLVKGWTLNQTTTSASISISASDVALDSFGNIFAIDPSTNAIIKLNATTQLITPIGGEGGYNGDGPVALKTLLNKPTQIAGDKFGNIYIVDSENQLIRKFVVQSGTIATIAGGNPGILGDNEPASKASFSGMTHISTDKSGNIYVADKFHNRVRKIDVSNGMISTIAGNGSCGITMTEGMAVRSEVCQPNSVAISENGDIYVTEENRGLVRKVTSKTGLISTVAGNFHSASSESTVCQANEGQALTVLLCYPGSLAIDEQDNLYFTNDGVGIMKLSNGKLSVVIKSGSVNLPGEIYGSFYPLGILPDDRGHLYISSSSVILKMAISDGSLSRVAGSAKNDGAQYYEDGVPSLNAKVSNPHGLFLLGDSDLYFADTDNNVIRRIDNLQK